MMYYLIQSKWNVQRILCGSLPFSHTQDFYIVCLCEDTLSKLKSKSVFPFGKLLCCLLLDTCNNVTNVFLNRL